MRPSVDQSLMDIAAVWGKRSTCSRNSVGVVIAKDGRTLGSGYNGAPAGMPHCEHQVMTFEPITRTATFHVAEAAAKAAGEGCRIAIHAEANALAYCARNGVAVGGATIYTTLSPCYSCAQLIIAAGLARVVYGRPYRDQEGTRLLIAAGVTVERLV